MVLANGTVTTANQCNHPEIFWAVRGAGGGNLGIVTEIVMKAHKEVPLATISFTGTGLSLSQTSLTALTAAFAKVAPELGNQGFGGQVAIVNGLLSIKGIMPNKTVEDAKQAFAPIQNLSLGLDPKSLSIFAGSFQFGTSPTWYDYGIKNFGGNQKEGIGLITASWLIPAASFENPENLAKQLQDSASKGSIAGAFGFLQVGGNQTGARGQGINQNDPSTTSVTPAWNSAVWHLIFGQIAISNKPGESLQTDISYGAAYNSRKALTQYIPNSGAYQNEADIFQDDPRQAFWGTENYNRLLSIKQQIDPQNLFSIWQGIGWVENGGKDFESDAPDGRPYSCYPSL
ncbi:hypothetical protein L7F22_043840 [Adiantum nelumboides]|nr:hypothetical protein [Adiantum nelumboides]